MFIISESAFQITHVLKYTVDQNILEALQQWIRVNKEEENL